MSFPPPQCAVWELTLACNLRCRYCGSAAGRQRPAELDTAEALDLCQQLYDLGVGRVSLMGGEPLLRHDWSQILARLQQLGQPVEVISNGMLVDRDTALRLRDYDIYGLSLSLDGPAQEHDSLRGCQGSFAKVEKAVEYCQEAGLAVGIVTQINKDNLSALDALYELLVCWQIDGWQLQLTSALGAATGTDCTIAPRQVVELHSWALHKQSQGRVHLYFTDDIGYFHPAEPQLRSGAAEDSCWLGCQAGLGTLGIASDGSIRGCLSLPEKFTEDSIRHRSLQQIWNDLELFAYNRKGHPLHGDCAGCVYAKICRGGCKSFAYASTGHFGEMSHCWYRLAGKNQDGK